MSVGPYQRGEIDGIIPKIIDEFACLDETGNNGAGINNDADVKVFMAFFVEQKL